MQCLASQCMDGSEPCADTQPEIYATEAVQIPYCLWSLRSGISITIVTHQLMNQYCQSVLLIDSYKSATRVTLHFTR